MAEVSFQLAVVLDQDLFEGYDFDELPASLLEYICDLPKCEPFGDKCKTKLAPAAFREMRLTCVGRGKVGKELDEGLGFDWYTPLHADRSMWRATIINFVHFDCLAGETTIMFVDGTSITLDMLKGQAGDTLQDALAHWFRYVLVCYDYFCALAPFGETLIQLLADMDEMPPEEIKETTGLATQNIDVEQHLHDGTFTERHLLDGIQWLKRSTRSELLNIFARFINPVLKELLPNTYPQWCAESKLERLRAQARKASGELATLLNEKFNHVTRECQTWIRQAIHRDHKHQSEEDDTLEEKTFGLLTTNDSGIIVLGSTIVEAALQEEADDAPASPAWESHSSDDSMSSDHDQYGPSENDHRAACQSPPSSSNHSHSQSDGAEEEDYHLAYAAPQPLTHGLMQLFDKDVKKRIRELNNHIAQLDGLIYNMEATSITLDEEDDGATWRELVSLRQIDSNTPPKRPKGAKAKARLRALKGYNSTVSPINRTLRVRRNREAETSAEIAKQLLPKWLQADHVEDQSANQIEDPQYEDAQSEPDIIVRPDLERNAVVVLGGLKREASMVYDDSGVGMMLDLPSSFSGVDAMMEENALSNEDEDETWFRDFAREMLVDHGYRGYSEEGDDGDTEMPDYNDYQESLC